MSRPRRYAAVVSSALPHNVVRTAARTLRRGSWLSVVVVVTDDNVAFLDDCVGALGAQSRRADEILLVVTGTAARTDLVVRGVTGSSWRIVRCDLPGRSGPEAMTAGAARASGSLLFFCDAGDTVAEGVLAGLLDGLLLPAAELAGAVPEDVGRVRLGDLMVRRGLWERTSAGVPEGPHAEWLSAARLVLAARGTAPAVGATRTGQRRGSGVAFGTMPVRAPWVEDWAAGVREVLALLEGRPALMQFLRWLLEEEVPWFLEDAERCTPRQWEVLADVTTELLARSGPAEVADLRVESRVRLWLAAHGRRDDLERFNLGRWLEEGQFPTRLCGDRVVADLRVPGDDLPEEVLTLGPSETRLVTRLRRLRWIDASTLELEVLAHIPHVGSDSAESSARLTLVGPNGAGVHVPVQHVVDPEANLRTGDRFADHSAGVLRGSVDVEGLLADARPGDRWSLEVEVRIGEVTRQGSVDDVDLRGSAGAFPVQGPGKLGLRSSGAGPGNWFLEAVPTPAGSGAAPVDGWSLTGVVLDGGEAFVTGTAAPGAAADGLTLTLHGPQTTEGVALELEDGRFRARVSLDCDPWGTGRRALPAGTYRFQLRAPGRQPLRLRVAPELAAVTPSTQRSAVHRLRLQRGLDGAALLTLTAPLADDEIGPAAQQRLQRWYASDEHRLDPSAVYLQSYTGQTATDSPLAIHQALRRQRPDLTLHWAVADSSTPVPPGSRPVLLRSREWYATLASAGWIVTNIDMDRWFEKRPGQQLLQTFHGYPSKTMGIAAWEGKNFTPLRIEQQLRRTSGTWDLLLTPAPAMDEHYRREYRYDGRILAEGYPRDDALVGPDRDRTREETRRRLGLRPGQRAVLYAPTWRDDLATNFRAAALSPVFDVELAARELGDDYVILLRGHRFHRRRGDLAGARLLDVTDYPEINDLILAADVAVLDYSSLRFDFALTGRPMVFLVPDLDRYTGGVRGFLYDFSSSAPGPKVATTTEVVAALRDLDGLARAHREDLIRFNQEFNGRQDGHAAERVVAAFFGPLA